MTQEELDRFHKFCGLLGSEHDGERAAAALKATGLLRQHGLTWADIVVPMSIAEASAREREAEDEYNRRRAEMAEEVQRESERRRERWRRESAPKSPSAEFYESLSESIRRATGGEDGLRDPRMRRGG